MSRIDGKPDGSTSRVAVVIPAFNAASFLHQTIQSVLDQTHQVFQLVVVDDGSSDSTLDVAGSFRDQRVVVITGSHRGVSAARNLGINSADSDLIAFLDADDYWLEHKLATQIAYLEAHPALVGVGALMRYVSTAGSILGVAGQEIGLTDLDAIRKGLLMPFPLSSFLVRREVVDEVGGFDETLDTDVPGQVEDLDFLARAAGRGPVGIVREMLGGYRLHLGSATMRHFTSQQMGIRYVGARLAARPLGVELSWREFQESYRLTWKERHRDRVRGWYRRAGVSAADRRWLASIGFGALALFADPFYTLPRAVRQHTDRS